MEGFKIRKTGVLKQISRSKENLDLSMNGCFSKIDSFVRTLCSTKDSSVNIQIVAALNAEVWTSVAVHRWFYSTLAIAFLAAWNLVQLVDFVLTLLPFNKFPCNPFIVRLFHFLALVMSGVTSNKLVACNTVNIQFLPRTGRRMSWQTSCAYRVSDVYSS
jgi:hypothetical protein